MDGGLHEQNRTLWNFRKILLDITVASNHIMADLPTFYEIKAEDLPPFGKKVEDFYARKI